MNLTDLLRKAHIQSRAASLAAIAYRTPHCVLPR